MAVTSADKYAQPELERRFLLEHVPRDATDPRRITDRYLINTRLRLRTVEDASTGRVTDRKLGQKVRPNPDDATVVWHTSLYLNPAEAAALGGLPGVEITKTRYRWTHDGHDAAVDHYHLACTELIVAELGFADVAELAAYLPSVPLGAEITHIPALTGPNLATLDANHLAHHTQSPHPPR